MIAIDTGGTFTDFVLRTSAGIRIHKERSTPDDPARAILRGLSVLDPEARESVVLYGTTLATNALLEGKGARVALLTTAGFEDVLEIGRQARSRLYDLHPRKPAPLVPARLRLGVRERIATSGRTMTPLAKSDVRRALRFAKRAGARSIAVCFLNAFASARHERAAARVAARAGFDVCASHEVCNEFREHERFTVTAINAATAPLLRGFLQRLASALGGKRRLWVMQSDGGMLPPPLAGRFAVRTILSGPAGGVTGVVRAGRACGRAHMIGLDIGGTSTDVSLSEGEVPLMTEGRFGEYPVRLPMVDVHSVGAGGGSIARVDDHGRLRVGPESAGADPGPMCYGRGRALTVTDANLFLGRLDPRGLLEGECTLDRDAVATAMAALARRLKLTAEAAAEGIVAVANARMEAAIRAVSVERGIDPRRFTLLAFGGGGALHACALADALDIGAVLVPPHPGVFSAFGMLHARVSRTYAATVLTRWRSGIRARLAQRLRALELVAQRELGSRRLRCERSADVRYVGQSFELSVPFGPGLAAAFRKAHERAYGYADPGRALEIVTLRLRASVPAPEREGRRDATPPATSHPVRARFYEAGRWRACVHVRRAELGRGQAVRGPALILEYSATTYVPGGWRAGVDGRGNLVLVRERPRRTRRTHRSARVRPS